MRTLEIATILLTLVLLSGTAVAADWTMFVTDSQASSPTVFGDRIYSTPVTAMQGAFMEPQDPRPLPADYFSPSYRGAPIEPTEETTPDIVTLFFIATILVGILWILVTSREKKSVNFKNQGNGANDMQINKWKIFGYTVATWFLFSVLARILVELEPRPYFTIIDGQGVVWGWMSLFMGIYLVTKFKKWIELAWGAVLFFICTLPVIGMFIGIGYFARAYAKLEKARWGEEPEYRRREEEEQKAREVTEHGDKEETFYYLLKRK